jgi:hypothetical protein
MFTVWGQHHQFHGGMNRRQFLRVGGLGVAGLTLADLLRSDAQAEGATRRPKSLIYVVLSGGVSHIDSWDLKPGAPSEFRGEFRPTRTRVPGMDICELFPRQAAITDRLALVRGVRSVENDHFLSEVYTGLPRTAGQRPAFGSVVSRQLGGDALLPAYVSATNPSDYERPHYAGAGHAPFSPIGEAVDNLRPVQDLAQWEDRRSLLASFDTLRRDLDMSGALDGMDRFRTRAMEMLTSARARDAFDLSKEPNRILAAYGHRAGKYSHQADIDIRYDWDARPFILARRLVEAGVRVVTLSVGSWDHHRGPKQHIFQSYRLAFPLLDCSLCALVNDLWDRGLDQDVLVVVLGEFGRTPQINYPGPGREHWADAGCVLFAGGGLKMGQVVGETDARAEQSKSGQISFQNVMATLYAQLGIDLSTSLTDFTGRPQYLLDDKTPIRELLD